MWLTNGWMLPVGHNHTTNKFSSNIQAQQTYKWVEFVLQPPISCRFKGSVAGGFLILGFSRNPFKGTGARDFIWIKVVSLDRSW